MIRKIVLQCITICMFLFGFSSCAKEETATAPIPKENVFGMWFSYLDYQEVIGVVDEETFKTKVDEILDNMESIGINTIYLHAVAFTDSLYESNIYPRSKDVSSDYDPFKIWVEKAHARNIKVEAWINPFRSKLVGQEEELSPTLQEWIKGNDERVRIVDGRYYLNPAYPEVSELICSVAQELIDKYKVDGIHLDDYFYPENTKSKFDAYIYSEATEIMSISREDFRRNAVNQIVENLYLTVKKKNKGIKFGISTAGNNDNNYNLYFADIRAWIEKGTIDYRSPQIYWGFNHPTKPFTPTFEEFKGLITNPNIALYAGLAAYKVGTQDQWAASAVNEWIDNSDILTREMEYTMQNGGQGVAYFRYASLFQPNAEVQGNVEKEIINIKTYMKSFHTEE